jgi:hypothetical protein
LAILLIIGALVIFALWLIGLAARAAGYRIEYGSKKNASHTLSVISLARSWIRECGQNCRLTRQQLKIALTELGSQVRNL